MSITLRVTNQDLPDQGSMLKLIFTESESDLEDPPFYANRDDVELASNRVRTLLGRICARCLLLPVEEARRTFLEELPSLRQAGTELYEHLFVYDPNGVPRPTGDPCGRIEAFMLKANGVTQSLLVKCDGLTRVPWGFLYTPTVVALGNPANGNGEARPTEPGDWDGFWLQRFDIAVRLTQASPTPRALPMATFKSLYALHRRYAAGMTGAMGNSCHVVTNFDQWREYWTKIANTDSLLYFYGHSDGRSIFLDDVPPADPLQYCLDTSAIQSQFRLKRTEDTATLCFFNGCNTATGNAHSSFLQATHRKGFHGFIGTETEIPSHIAMGYATDFLKLLMRGKSVGDAFREMKFSDFFPWSLFYACNANPKLRIEQGEAAQLPPGQQASPNNTMGHGNA